jgi:adenylyltransferase/sulfurtransferase
MVASISPLALQQKLSNQEAIQLIDVRELFERNEFNIGGIHIPLQDIFEQSSLIQHDIPVVLYCQKGIRSHIAIQRLQERYNFNNLINLEGGMNAWRKLIEN